MFRTAFVDRTSYRSLSCPPKFIQASTPPPPPPPPPPMPSPVINPLTDLDIFIPSNSLRRTVYYNEHDTNFNF